MQNAWDLSIFTYAGREKAPAPVPVTATAEPVVPPVVEPVVDPAPVIPAQATAPSEEVTAPVDPEPEPEPAPAEEPEVPEPPLVIGSNPDPWDALTRGLLTNAVPSTVDELFAALQMKGLPA
jgi:hypothetical protein